MSLYKQFKDNTKAEREGVDIHYGESVVTIASANKNNIRFALSGKKHLKRLDELDVELCKLNDDIDNSDQYYTISAEIREILARVYAKSVIIGWKNVDDEQGDEIPYTEDNVVKLLLDLPDFFDDIQSKANAASTFHSKEVEEEKKP